MTHWIYWGEKKLLYVLNNGNNLNFSFLATFETTSLPFYLSIFYHLTFAIKASLSILMSRVHKHFLLNNFYDS